MMIFSYEGEAKFGMFQVHFWCWKMVEPPVFEGKVRKSICPHVHASNQGPKIGLQGVLNIGEKGSYHMWWKDEICGMVIYA